MQKQHSLAPCWDLYNPGLKLDSEVPVVKLPRVNCQHSIAPGNRWGWSTSGLTVMTEQRGWRVVVGCARPTHWYLPPSPLPNPPPLSLSLCKHIDWIEFAKWHPSVRPRDLLGRGTQATDELRSRPVAGACRLHFPARASAAVPGQIRHCLHPCLSVVEEVVPPSAVALQAAHWCFYLPTAAACAAGKKGRGVGGGGGVWGANKRWCGVLL